MSMFGVVPVDSLQGKKNNETNTELKSSLLKLEGCGDRSNGRILRKEEWQILNDEVAHPERASYSFSLR